MGVPVMYDSDGKSSADIAVSMVQTKKTVEITGYADVFVGHATGMLRSFKNACHE